MKQIGLCCLLFLIGCGTKLNPGTAVNSAACSTVDVTYTNQIQTILNQYCTSCHSTSSKNRNGAPKDINYNTYNQASAEASAGLQAMNAQSMPPSGAGPTDEELCLFTLWIEKGKPL